MKRFGMALIVMLMIGSLAIGQTTVMNVTYTTTAPTTGSAVHHYVWATSSNGTSWTALTATTTGVSIVIPAPVGMPILVRCAGVDAQGRQGVWSDASDPFVPDAGAPGVPGKPLRQ